LKDSSFDFCPKMRKLFRIIKMTKWWNLVEIVVRSQMIEMKKKILLWLKKANKLSEESPKKTGR